MGRAHTQTASQQSQDDHARKGRQSEFADEDKHAATQIETSEGSRLEPLRSQMGSERGVGLGDNASLYFKGLAFSGR